MKKIVLTGGGTGGHIFPNISLIPLLKKHFEIFYIGTANSLEENLVKNLATFYAISAPKVDRSKILANFSVPIKLVKSVFEAKKILKEIKPNVIFSKGGYVSLPVCIAGKMLKIPVVSHESDLTMGLANKLIYGFSTKMLTSFEKTSIQLKKGVFTGSPIREELFCGSKTRGYRLTNLNPNLETILFIGGSTGAKIINDTVFNSLPILTQKYNIIHITGKNKGRNVNFKNYYQVDFSKNIEDLLAISSMVVSRAGSNAIFEFLSLKKPMLLIPLSKKASRGDQILNAQYFEECGYSITLDESLLNPKTLIKKIEELDKKKNSLIEKMNSFKLTNSNEKIVKEILNVTK